jgi:hypothetical protein
MLVNRSNEMITLQVRDDLLSLAYLRSDKKNIVIHAQESIPLEAHEVANGQIFNITALAGRIHDFCRRSGVTTKKLVCAADGAVWHQNIVPEEQKNIVESFPKFSSLVWYDYALGSSTYIFGIARPYLVQFQLLALRAHLTCYYLTTIRRTLLHIFAGVLKNHSDMRIEHANLDAYLVECINPKRLPFSLTMRENNSVSPVQMWSHVGLFLLGVDQHGRK